MAKMRNSKKIERPLDERKWERENKIYHSKGSEHFFYGTKRISDYIAGHDMTTHPSLTKNKKPRKRFMKLTTNPNPDDKRTSYLNRHLRVVKEHYEDTGNKRLIRKKKWKVHKRDRKRKSAQLNLG